MPQFPFSRALFNFEVLTWSLHFPKSDPDSVSSVDQLQHTNACKFLINPACIQLLRYISCQFHFLLPSGAPGLSVELLRTWLCFQEMSKLELESKYWSSPVEQRGFCGSHIWETSNSYPCFILKPWVWEAPEFEEGHKWPQYPVKREWLPICELWSLNGQKTNKQKKTQKLLCLANQPCPNVVILCSKVLLIINL